MPALLKLLTPFAKWIGLNVLAPWIISKLNLLVEKIKKVILHKKKAAENEARNNEYENNPSDDSFGNSP